MTKKKSYIQQCQERDVVAYLRGNLSCDGSCHLRSKDIGKVVGVGKTSGYEILKRLREDRQHLWVVNEASNQDQYQLPFGIFPWRGAAQFVHKPTQVQKTEPHQLIDKPTGSAAGTSTNAVEIQKTEPYIPMVGSGNNQAGCRSAEYRSSNSEKVTVQKTEPQLPPAWALAAQSASAQARLDALNVRLTSLYDQYGQDAWTTPIQTTSARIDDTQAYLADLKVWKILVGAV